MSARPALVVCGAYVPNSGFTRVLSSVLPVLADTFDVHWVGMSYKDDVIRSGGLTIYPCNLDGGDVFGAYQSAELIAQLDARAVLLLNDFWFLKNYMPALEGAGDDVRVVTYCPLDGILRDVDMLQAFERVDDFVVFTAFAKDQFDQAFQQLVQSGSHFRFEGCRIIPHGVDTKVFHRLPDRRSVRARLFPDRPELADAFLVLNANRPMPRKHIDITIRGFAEFAAGKPDDVFLVLHHAIMQASERHGLLKLARTLQVDDRIILSEKKRDRDLSDGFLNDLYNACDVGLNTASGEGWGLVSFEHAAAGAAQVVPDNSACSELWSGSAEVVETEDAAPVPYSLLEMAPPTPRSVASALDRLYSLPNYLQTMSEAAYANALRPEFRWSRIAEDWKHCLHGNNDP